MTFCPNRIIEQIIYQKKPRHQQGVDVFCWDSDKNNFDFSYYSRERVLEKFSLKTIEESIFTPLRK